MDIGKPNKFMVVAASLFQVLSAKAPLHFLSFLCIWRKAVQKDKHFEQSRCFRGIGPGVQWLAPALRLGIEQTRQFATAEEAEYPQGLTAEYARLLEQVASDKGMLLDPFPNQPDKLHPQKQSSGRSVMPIIPEYLHVKSVALSTPPCTDDKGNLLKPLPNVPVGSRLLRTEEKRGVSDNKKTLYVFGIYHGCKIFVDVARSLWHPYDVLQQLPDLLIKVIFNALTCSKIDCARHRLNTLQQWRSWADELAGDEARLHEKMPSHVQKVMANKRVLLLCKIAYEQLEWPDKTLLNDLTQGFKLTGHLEATGIFKQQPKPAEMSVEELSLASRFLRPAIIGKCRQSAHTKLAKELYDITLEESTSKSWLNGPYKQQRVAELHGENWLPVRRFGVEQHGKVRCIDDFCENRLNQAVSTVDKISLRTMDFIIWTAMVICKHSIHQQHMQFRLSDGSMLTGEVHEDWKGGCDLKTTTIDLKSAYKQLPLHSSDVDKAIVTICNPSSQEVEFFSMNTLPFGASASVLHFNRISYLLWACGCYLGVLWASYFDDFPIVVLPGLEVSTMAAAKGMLGLLGFVYAKDKLEPPADKATMLGVELDLTESRNGVIRICNRQDRVDGICEFLDKMICDGSMRPADLPHFLGRLQFADMQLAGRLGKLAMRDLRERGTTVKQQLQLSDSEVDAIQLLRERLTGGKPRTLEARPVTKPWLLFTDGALEYEMDDKPSGTIGGVLVSPEGNVEVFGAQIRDDLLERWQADGKTHVIGLIELYAVASALITWKDLVKGRMLVAFVDNYSAQDTLIKGCATDYFWREVLMILEVMDEELSSHIWFARVPSKSNPADAPSRFNLDDIEFLKPFKLVNAVCPIHGSVLKVQLKETGVDG